MLGFHSSVSSKEETGGGMELISEVPAESERMMRIYPEVGN